MSRFKNKIVTGGPSGICLAAARQFIKEGAKVVVTEAQPTAAQALLPIDTTALKQRV